MSSTLKLLVKSPTGTPATFELEIGADATLADLQARLAREYDGKPAVEQQTLIFAGKVLKEPSVTMRQLIEQARSEPFEGPHSFHLVVRKPQQQQGASSVSTPATSNTAPPAAPRAETSSQPAPSASSPTDANSSSSPPNPGPTHPEAAASTSTSTGAAPDASTGPAAEAMFMQPYMYVNPVYAAAYQAAYQAALAAAMQQPGHAQSPGLIQAGAPSPYVMTGMGYMPAAPVGGMPMQGAAPLHVQFAYNPAMQQPMVAHIQAGPHGPEIRIEGVRQDALGPVAMALANLRQRRGGNQAPGHQMQHGMHVHVRQRRPRGIMLRISVRTILQVLVFAMVLYQHFMWHRFIALLVGGLVLYLTSAWGPLRRALANLQQPPPAPGQRPPAAAAAPAGAADGGQPQAAGGQAGEGDAADAGAAGAGAAGAGAGDAAAPAQPRPRGWVQELLVLLLGFVTSLLPAWNYNPEDAAAFAAAQDMAAREDRAMQQQERGLGGPAAGVAAGAMDEAGNAAPEPGAPAMAGDGGRGQEANAEAVAAA